MRIRQLTIGELSDYLSQFPRTASVYLHVGEMPERGGDAIALDLLDYHVEDSSDTPVWVEAWKAVLDELRTMRT